MEQSNRENKLPTSMTYLMKRCLNKTLGGKDS